MVSVHLSFFLGRPRGLSGRQIPRPATISPTQDGAPKRRPLTTERRTPGNSRAVSGAWTHFRQ
jgi:hypothetical protein